MYGKSKPQQTTEKGKATGNYKAERHSLRASAVAIAANRPERFNQTNKPKGKGFGGEERKDNSGGEGQLLLLSHPLSPAAPSV